VPMERRRRKKQKKKCPIIYQTTVSFPMSTRYQIYFKVSPATVDQPFGQYNSSTSHACV
jgi:hypothetical protein